MSVSSYSEHDLPLPQNNSNDFYCTEEELFQSFMEIVNDPTLQGLSKANDESSSDVLNKVSCKSIEEEGLKKNENEEMSCKSNPNDSGSVGHLDPEKSNSIDKTDQAQNQLPVKNGMAMSHENHESSQTSSVPQKDNSINDNEHSPSDLNKGEQLSGVTIEQSAEIKHENGDSKDINESSEKVDSELIGNNTDELTVPVTTADQDSKVSGVKQDNTGENDSQTLKSSSNNEEQSSINPIKRNEQSSMIDVKPASESKTVQAGSSKQEMNEDEVEGVVSSSVQPSTNQEEGQLSANQNEHQATNQSEGHASLKTNESEVQPSANQNKLKVIENDIEEGIRKTNEVCAELNAIMQRLSQSSDELLGDNDSDSQKIQESHTTALTTVTSGDCGLIENNNILESKVNAHASPEIQTADKSVATKNGRATEECSVVSEAKETKQPYSLPKLVVTIQASSITSPSLIGTSTSPSVESSNSPLGLSPTYHNIDKDRTYSMSDSLDSSEGSLNGDTKSVGPSPIEAKEPINWEILNTAFENPDTDEEEDVYETTGSYGGFGLVLDYDVEDGLAVDDDTRFRSVSQSSTVSEVEFQEEYKKKHSIGSLETNIDGVLCSGYLLKLGGTGITPKNWRKRWCVLRQDRCLYYYKNARAKIPCGIVVLANYIISHSSECSRKNCIKISKGGARTYFFCSDSQKDMLRWMEALRKAAENAEEGTSFVIRKEIIHNVAIPALSIKKPDCHGYLTKQGGKSARSWKRRYCVLKKGCLYYYREMADTTALGVAKLHGYTVEDDSTAGRRNGFRCVPPYSGMRMFSFVADNEYDKKRWIPCFQESIRANTPS